MLIKDFTTSKSLALDSNAWTLTWQVGYKYTNVFPLDINLWYFTDTSKKNKSTVLVAAVVIVLVSNSKLLNYWGSSFNTTWYTLFHCNYFPAAYIFSVCNSLLFNIYFDPLFRELSHYIDSTQLNAYQSFFSVLY